MNDVRFGPIFMFESADIERSREAIAAGGAESTPISRAVDRASFEFRDPDGNALSVVQWFQLRVVELGEQKLVGIRVRCPGDRYIVEIPKAAAQLKTRLDEIPFRSESTAMIGAFMPGDFSDEEDGYWVCVRVDRFGDVPEGMATLTVPPQRYALKWHYGPNTEVRNTYARLHELMREAGLEREQRAWHLEMARRWGEGDAQAPVEPELYETIRG